MSGSAGGVGNGGGAAWSDLGRASARAFSYAAIGLGGLYAAKQGATHAYRRLLAAGSWRLNLSTLGLAARGGTWSLLTSDTPLVARLQLLGVQVFSFVEGPARRSTYGNQADLPHLPLPKLEDTRDRTITSLEPLKERFSDWSHTQRRIQEFFAHPKVLEYQGKLEERAQKFGNWLKDIWEKVAYLSNRASLALSSTWYGIDAFVPRVFPNSMDPQLARASLDVSLFLEFKELMETGRLPPQVLGGAPLCMDQFNRAFATYREAKKGEDVLISTPNSDYAVVMVKDHIYKLPVYKRYEKDGQQVKEYLSKEELYYQLQRIREMAESSDVGKSTVALLTALNRDECADAFEKLEQDPLNKQSVDIMRGALFSLTLDDGEPPKNATEQAERTVQSKRDVWWNMGQQIKVYKGIDQGDGYSYSPVGILEEHSGCDATIITTILDYILKKHVELREKPQGWTRDKGDEDAKGIVKFAAFEGVEPEHCAGPTPVCFNQADVVAEIAKAEGELTEAFAEYDQQVLEFDSFSSRDLANLGISPDSFVQMAIQLTHHELTGQFDFVYETGTTRWYLEGRTETVRSLSNESRAFVELMRKHGEDGFNQEATKTALYAALAKHKEYVDMAMAGQGVDRHMAALQDLAQEEGDADLAPFFAEEWFNMQHGNDTSQTPCDLARGGGFKAPSDKPVGEGGVERKDKRTWGVSYKLQRPYYFNIHSHGKGNAQEFASALEKNLRNMMEVVKPTNK